MSALKIVYSQENTPKTDYPDKLAKYLFRYAATGKEYTTSLEKSIKANSLDDFDEAKLLTAKSVKGVDL